MKKPIFSAPEPFSLSPLLALLPVRGKIGRLESLTSSLYARYEKVAAQQAEKSEQPDRAIEERIAAESQMLKQVLDWLAVKPER
jgi:hypothetical protein